jgi:hypothetical protein
MAPSTQLFIFYIQQQRLLHLVEKFFDVYYVLSSVVTPSPDLKRLIQSAAQPQET